MLRRDHVLANRICFPFMLMSYILYTESAVMLITQTVLPNLLPSEVNIDSGLINLMHSMSNKVNIGCNLISLALGKPIIKKSDMIGQIVFLNHDWSVFNIYAAISIFEPVALAVFERFGVNHLALNSLFYSVIHLTAN